MKKLLDVQPGDLLASGIFPALPGDAPILWVDGENVIFESGLVKKAPGHTGLSELAVRPRGIKSAQAIDTRRVYVGQGDGWGVWTGSGFQTIEDGLSGAGGNWIFTPWGEHVVANNQVDGLRYWTGSGSGAAITTPFAYALTGGKFLGHQFVGNTDLGANYLHWSEQNNYAAWDVLLTNTAGDRELRDLDGGLTSFLPLGSGAIGLYTQSSLSLLTYIGGTLRFDTQLNKVPGIGAIGHYSVIPVGPRHYGLMRSKVFVTDGVSFQLKSEPAVEDWLEENVNWDRASEVYGWHDMARQMVRWVVPIGANDFRSVGFRYGTERWTKFNDGLVAGDEGGIFNSTIVASSGSLLRSDPTTGNSNEAAMSSFIQTKPLDCGDRQINKLIDKIDLDLDWTGNVELLVGFSTYPNEDPEWVTAQPAAREVWLDQSERREGAEIHLKLQSSEAGVTWKLSGFKIHGEPAGYVN